MKVKLEDYNGNGEITKEEICKDVAEAKSKAVGKQYFRVHKCFHDEVPWKPCEVVDKKLPVVINEELNP